MAPRTVGALAQTSSVKITTRGGSLARWAFAESTGSAAARVRLWDGDDNTGELLVPVALVEGTSQANSVRDQECPFGTGLYLEVVAGEVEWSVTFDDGS